MSASLTVMGVPCPSLRNLYCNVPILSTMGSSILRESCTNSKSCINGTFTGVRLPLHVISFHTLGVKISRFISSSILYAGSLALLLFRSRITNHRTSCKEVNFSIVQKMILSLILQVIVKVRITSSYKKNPKTSLNSPRQIFTLLYFLSFINSRILRTI